MQDIEKKEINIEEKTETPKDQKESCPECGSDIVEKKNKTTEHRFFGCSAYPKCNYIKGAPKKINESCPKCTKNLVIRENKDTQVKFVACTGYPECRYTLNIDIYKNHMENSPNEPLPIIDRRPRDFSNNNSTRTNDGEKSQGSFQNKRSSKDSKSFRGKPQSRQPKQSFTGFNEKVVAVKRISKTTKGGRSMRFSALVIIGDKKGLVGYGMGKSIEVPVAIRKALKDAKNNIRKVKITKKGTLFHEIIGRQGAGRVLLKPAPEGTGIIAGGPIRVALELAGFTDMYSKNLGKNTSLNMVMATLDGLSKQKTPKEIANLRDKDIKNL